MYPVFEVLYAYNEGRIILLLEYLKLVRVFHLFVRTIREDDTGGVKVLAMHMMSRKTIQMMPSNTVWRCLMCKYETRLTRGEWLDSCPQCGSSRYTWMAEHRLLLYSR